MKICVGCNQSFDPRRKDMKYCSNTCGNNVRSQRWRDSGKEQVLRKTPKGRYHLHKTNAEARGVPFLLTFEEWWSVWEPHWIEADDLRGKFCMCRNGDKGAYELGNVRIDTWENNLKERHQLYRELQYLISNPMTY